MPSAGLACKSLDNCVCFPAPGGCHAVASTRLQSLKLVAPHLCMELVRQLPNLPELRDLKLTLEERYVSYINHSMLLHMFCLAAVTLPVHHLLCDHGI